MDLLGVPDADRDAVLATLPDPDRDPQRWAHLHRHHSELFGSGPVAWPKLDGYFYVHLYLLALPTALARQRRLGIPEDVTRQTFADLGEKMRTYRLTNGVGGFDLQEWLVRHFRGTLYRLGRLQFERSTLDASACGGSAEPHGPADGEPVLDVHVPGDGPMPPALCDASFARAATFFPRYFPRATYRHVTCGSWLLDEQLAAHLPADSNIVRFQRRFSPFGDRPASDDILLFVFNTPLGTADLDRLPQDSTLRRAVVAHLRGGGRWRIGHGWAALDQHN